MWAITGDYLSLIGLADEQEVAETVNAVCGNAEPAVVSCL
jgi:hypothetical protein